jgi:Na+/melibiose symporter-like transporter
MNESHEVGAYRIAVAAVGVALIVALAGICTIVAVGHASDIPKELWTMVSSLGGGLLGLLAPTPTKKEEKPDGPPVKKGFWADLFKDAWANRSVVILLVVFVLSVVAGAISGSTPTASLAGASGAALLGLLAPGNSGKKGSQES